MATQGLITIVDNNDSVLYKIIAGSDGHRIEKLKEIILKNKDANSFELYSMAQIAGFGADDNLVISHKSGHLYRGDEPILKGGLYDTKFAQPDFNPRWECGLVDYYELLKEEDYA